MEEELKLTEQAQTSLLKAMKWLKFFAVLGVIAIILMLIMAIVFLIIPNSEFGGYSWLMSLLYLVVTLLYTYPVWKAFAIISNTRKAINTKDQMSLELAAKDFHSVMKFCGILTIICLVIYVLVFLIGIAISIPLLAAL